MHTIQEATKLVIRDTMRWINKNKNERPGWAVLNFPGVFLFHCSHLRRTREFSAWGNQRFMKTKWLYHNFDGATLQEIKFTYPDTHHLQVGEVNKWLQYHLSNPSYWDAEEWKPEVIVAPRVLTKRPEMNNFSTLENFSFKPKEERILVSNV